LRQLRFDQPLDVVWPAGRAVVPHGPKPAEIVARVEFRRRRNRSETHLEKLATAPRGAEVLRIDSRVMRRCLWRDDVLRATGSTSEFLGHGLGFCLEVGKAIVAEAYAVIWSEDRAEIATVTHPEHRGRGHATVLCASLIQACEAVGLKTYWNCDARNEASVRLATRLGYIDPHEYRLLRYPQQGPVSRRPAKRPASFGRFARRLLSRVAGRK
jgi:RimJ/RimL family protein N-acetyltransferase